MELIAKNPITPFSDGRLTGSFTYFVGLALADLPLDRSFTVSEECESETTFGSEMMYILTTTFPNVSRLKTER